MMFPLPKLGERAKPPVKPRVHKAMAESLPSKFLIEGLSPGGKLWRTRG